MLEGFEISTQAETNKEAVLKYLEKNGFAFAIAVTRKLGIPVSTALYILHDLVADGNAIDMGMTNARMNGRNRQVHLFKKISKTV